MRCFYGNLEVLLEVAALSVCKKLRSRLCFTAMFYSVLPFYSDGKFHKPFNLNVKGSLSMPLFIDCHSKKGYENRSYFQKKKNTQYPFK